MKREEAGKLLALLFPLCSFIKFYLPEVEKIKSSRVVHVKEYSPYIPHVIHFGRIYWICFMKIALHYLRTVKLGSQCVT